MKREDIMISVLGDDFDNHESFDALKSAIDYIEDQLGFALVDLDSFIDCEIIGSNEIDSAHEIIKELKDDLY